jgi:hypothetical protein
MVAARRTAACLRTTPSRSSTSDVAIEEVADEEVTTAALVRLAEGATVVTASRARLPYLARRNCAGALLDALGGCSSTAV